ncbi:GumC family protein [Methylosinus sp. Sm6]|uniref:GumC family protein n=1 Tax=Methylosinus sp. Sm6 TaxID=2866948 RepID=UPI001C9981C4|nr:GumC family protein [Methylosinus sp. Sm6]MBY6243107.1 lipopolysaccharide biosynthesis protein [Methylosinus sp. Sm6]
MSAGDSRDVEPMAQGEIDLGQIASALSRHRRIVIGVTLAALVGALLFVNLVKPRYTAEARVLLENQESYLTRSDKGERSDSAMAPDAEAVQSQIQLLTSRDLARRALKSLELEGNVEFDPLAGGPGLLTRIGVALGVLRDPSRLSPEERMLDAYFERLTILSPTKTRVLQIEFSSRDPDLAARAANAIAATYIDMQREAKRENARAAARALSPLVADLRVRVAEAEGKVEEFRIKSGLLAGSNNVSIATQQLGDLTNQLSLSRTSEADAEAKARLVREMLRQNRVGEIPDVANNEMIRRIGEQRVALRAQLALESRTLLPAHPRIKELNAQLADLEGDLRRAAERTARTLENESHIAAARVENLTRVMERQKKIAGQAGAEEVQLRELERAAHVLKEQFEADSAKYQEALAREGAKSSPADARVIQAAVAPPNPSFPKKLPITAFAAIAAFVLSAGGVVAAELLTGRPRLSTSRTPPAVRAARVEPTSMTEADRDARDEQRSEEEDSEDDEDDDVIDDDAVDRPTLFRRAALRVASGDADPMSEQDEQSERAEARIEDMREVVGRITAGDDQASVAVLLVGCADARGSCRTAAALARSLARRGAAILVCVDDDDEYDGLVAGEDPEPPLGFADLVARETTFASAIHKDAASRLHVMPGGCADARFDEDASWVLEALSRAYDFVVVATRRYERAVELAPSFDLLLVSGGDKVAELVRDELEQAGVDDVVLLEDDALTSATAA